jgi:hypothetical protein
MVSPADALTHSRNHFRKSPTPPVTFSPGSKPNQSMNSTPLPADDYEGRLEYVRTSHTTYALSRADTCSSKMTAHVSDSSSSTTA